MSVGTIRKATVIGAGTMGRGIAAHLANAQIPVDLLDIVPEPEEGDDPEEPAFRNRVAREAIEGMASASPLPAVYDDQFLDLITPGNIEDHLDRMSDSDWVVEAVPENMAIKQDTFDKIEEHAPADAVISSNTSGLSIQGMLEGRSESFRSRFLVTHFFNPVRMMKLLELVPAPGTDEAVVDAMEDFGRDVLGKGIVFGKDTTNFVANRIGVHDQMVAMHTREKFDMTFEDVDQVLREPLARPSSAMFKLTDIIGIDTFVHVATNCYESLTEDEDRDLFRVPEYIEEMVERGWTGRKAGQGFYQKTDEGIEALRLDSWEYELRDHTDYASLEAAEGSAEERVRAVVVEGDDEAAEYAREVTLQTVGYAARRLGEIADDVVNVDRAMRWGFNWELGPFQLWDAIGLEWGLAEMKDRGIGVPDWAEQMVAEGREQFYRRDGSTRLYYDPFSEAYEPIEPDPKRFDIESQRLTQSPIFDNDSATVHDMGDGVALVEFHTKMNSVNDEIIETLGRTIEWVEDEDWRGMVVGNNADHFSAGANLDQLLRRSEDGNWEAIENQVTMFQETNQRLRYSQKPVVTAPHGYTLGGGAEVAMAGNMIQAHAELVMGLVEVGVGLIPGAGGNLQLLRKVYGPYADEEGIDAFPFIKQVFNQISAAKTATSGDGARRAGFLDRGDAVSLNGDHLLHAARQRVIAMDEAGFRPPPRTQFRLPGPEGVGVLKSMMFNWAEGGYITDYDCHVGEKLARVLCGGDTSSKVTVTESHILEVAREAFLSLCGEEKTRARMRHMLEHGKPLRN